MKLNIDKEDYFQNGIYEIHNVVSNKYYIGQTSEGFYKRFLRHNNLLKNNKHFNFHLQKSYNKHGSDAFVFSIVEICSAENLEVLEKKYIQQYRDNYACYNVLEGGETMHGKNNPFYGHKHTKESIEKMVEKSIGRSAGEKNNFYGEDHSGKNNPFYGHKHTEESKQKMSKTKSKMYKGSGNPFYGKTHTPEVIARIRRSTMEATHREVVCIETGVEYRSIAEAGRQTGISAKQISAVCAGHGLTAGKLHWRYVDSG